MTNTRNLIIDICGSADIADVKVMERESEPTPRTTEVFRAAAASINEWDSATGAAKGPCGPRPKRYLAERWFVVSWIES
jgi:hypothetical protein